MQRSISGKLYNTDSAKQIGYWTNAEFVQDDSEMIYEALYRKRSGEYFLHGKGGPATRYGHRVKGMSWKKGEDIIPLTRQQAYDWAKDNLSYKVLQAEFGTVQEKDDEKNKMLTLYLPESIVEMLRRLAADFDKSMSGIVADLIRREYRDEVQTDKMMEKIMSSYAEREGKKLLEEYEAAKQAGQVPEIPPELDAKCRALIEAAAKRGEGNEEN